MLILVLAEATPRRESSKRAAKERSNIKLIAKREEEGEDNDFVDSDSDPAWTPQHKDDIEQDLVLHKKTRRGRRKINKFMCFKRPNDVFFFLLFQAGRKRQVKNFLNEGIHDSDSSNDAPLRKQKSLGN